MGTPDASPGQTKYYDPSEVEAYVRDVTNTVKSLQARLQEATRRAAEAERALGDHQPETASLGRALLLAGEVADKTIAEADTRAAAIIRAAEDRAAGVVAAAETEARRLVEAARYSATQTFQNGEARLLAAVSAFVEGSNVLRGELARIQDDATNLRNSMRPAEPRDHSDFSPPPPRRREPEIRAENGETPRQLSVPEPPPPGFPSSPGPTTPEANGFDTPLGGSLGGSHQPDLPPGIHNPASRDLWRRATPDFDSPPATSRGPENGRAGERT